MQRTATPLTPVRFRPQPPFTLSMLLQRSQEDPVARFDVSLDLGFTCNVAQAPSPGGEIGRRKGLKIPRWKHRAGSIPAPGTI